MIVGTWLVLCRLSWVELVFRSRAPDTASG
jgi:hypothetical protein